MPENILNNIGISYGDFIVLIIFFFAILFYGIFLGKHRLISLILAFYPASLLYHLFPYADRLIFLDGDILIFINQTIIFLVLLVPINIIINRYLIIDSGYSGAPHILKTAGYAISGLILVMIFFYTIVSLDPVHNFSTTIDTLFSSPVRIFWANVLSLLILAFL